MSKTTVSKTTDELDRLYNQRAELLDEKYRICQEQTALYGGYVDADLPITKAIAKLTARIKILEDELRAQEQDAEIRRVFVWWEPGEVEDPYPLPDEAQEQEAEKYDFTPCPPQPVINFDDVKEIEF